jgi:acyl phosphate:glycerol-3-phosphate acyltransferase
VSDVGIPNLGPLVLGILAGILVAAFLIGSIPFGFIIGRLFYHTDIRKSGSGNIGAMNALRTMGKGGAIAVLLLDAAKGFVPIVIVRLLTAPLEPAVSSSVLGAVALATVLGHCFSPWLGWKGGKGVATSFGAIFALSWQAGLIAVFGWIAAALVTHYSSVGSMFGSVLAPVALWIFTGSLGETLYGALAAVLIVFMHRENIGRLRAGTEGPIRLSKSKPKDG